MKKIFNIIITGVFVVSTALAQVPVPVKAQEGPIMLVGGVVHVGDGQIIQNAAVGFNEGKLTFVGPEMSADKSGYEVINVEGKQIYPGFILPNSQVGLQEVSSVRAMSDMAEQGDINPNVRSVISYNTDSEFIATFRFNGVLLAETTPLGGMISGTSSVMEMEGWNWEDATHTADMGMHMNWPQKMRRSFDFATFTVRMEPNRNYDDQVSELSRHFKEAVAYGAASSKVTNLKLAAMQRLFRGGQTLFIHADGPKEIVESVKFAQDHGVEKIVVVAGSEALMVADFLKDNDIGVIIPPTHRLPETPDTDVYGPYKLPAQLFDAGLTVALSHSGMLAHARNLPFSAGTAVAYGLDKEEALKMITSNPAKLLGIADRVGTLEVGKDATLFVSEGDALDFRTNILSHAFISGKQVTLDNKQQELFQRFSRKYGHID
jgi:imidazolonepropionase-like amidohydrolase